MTTTVTVTTHGWPVRVTTTDRFQADRAGILHVETRDMDRWSEQAFHLTDARSISFEELPGWEDKPEEPETSEQQT